MKEQIEPEVKKKRSKKVIELSEEIRKEYNENYIGKKVEVLVEEKEGEEYKGHTKNYICVKIRNSKEDIRNKIVTVKIAKNYKGELVGERSEN